MTLQQFSDMPAALEAAGADFPRYKDMLARCNAFFTHYAGLEETLLGEVAVQFPAHLLEKGLAEDPVLAGEDMAKREHERLPKSNTALDGMQVFLDREQFKVYRFESVGDETLLGFFLFDPVWGPVFAVNRSLSRGETDRVFAQQYGNFLMDNDPYEIQLLWRDQGAQSDSQVRASAFASTFLISEAALVEYLSALSLEPQDLSPSDLEQLAVFFGTSPTMVALRCVALGWISPRDMADLLEGVDTGAAEWDRSEDGIFGDRFVLLALEAEAREAIDLETLARYLETSTTEAALWKERFRLTPLEEDELEPAGSETADDPPDMNE